MPVNVVTQPQNTWLPKRHWMTMTRLLPKRLFWLALIGLIGGFTALYIAYSEKLVPPWDPSSLVVLGQSLVQHGSVQYWDANNALVGPYFNPHGFDIRAPSDSAPYSTFPPGFSLVLAPVYALTNSLNWLYLVPPILGAVGLAAAAYIGYVLSGRWGSIFAIVMMGTSHVITTFSTSLWSDGPSLDLLLIAVALYIAATFSNRQALVILSSLILGGFILFKFVNVVFAILIPAHQLVVGQGRRRFIVAGILSLGLLAGIAGMLVYNASAYGGPLASAYQPWGQKLYDVPLFSLQYLFLRSPAPWSDYSGNAIVLGMLRDMHIWSLLFLIGIVIDRHNPWRLLLALIAITNILLYAVSVFTPRQFINMRYLLPALAVGYLLAADVLARLVAQRHSYQARVALAGLAIAVCVGNLLWTCLPDLTSRNNGTAYTINAVVTTAQALPAGSVVLAYNLADTFILYGHTSVLNYRRIESPDLKSRNQIVIQAIDHLLCLEKPVYLVQDDQQLFNSIYPDLSRAFVLQPATTPLESYRVIIDHAKHCLVPPKT